jgi:hypothetical protein
MAHGRDGVLPEAVCWMAVDDLPLVTVTPATTFGER